MKPIATGQPTLAGMPELPELDIDKAERIFDEELKIAFKAWQHLIEWSYKEQAENELRTTSKEYLKGLSTRIVDDGVMATLDGWLPAALEEGVPRFDLKPGFLKGRQWRVIPVGAPGQIRFRTVSQHSPKDSWWHPGLEARNISERVREDVRVPAQRLFQDIFKRIKF